MHPSLQVENLSGLPIAYRCIAISAAHGSLPDIHKLINLRKKMDESEAIRLLPAFCPHFDPTKIPDVDDVHVSTEGKAATERALLSLMAVPLLPGASRFPDAVALELWPQVWTWIEALWLYPRLLSSGETVVSTMAHACVWFSRYPEVAAIVDKTPAFWVFLAHASKLLVSSINAEYTVQDFVSAFEVVGHLDTMASHIQDIIEGAGGGIDDLASLVVAHLSCLVLFPRVDDAGEMCPLLWMTVVLFARMSLNIDARMTSLLVGKGFVKALVSSYLGISNTLGSVPAKMDDLFVLELCRWLYVPPGYPWVAEALGGGLLRAILLCGRRADGEHTLVKELLRTVIPNAMMYHSVLRQLESSLTAAKTMSNPTRGLHPEVREEYVKFLGFALERIAVMKWCDDPLYTTRQACDNMACGKIDSRSDFFRCGACHDAYYCSRECQSADWNAGSHRACCNDLRLDSLRENAYELSRRDASFLRTLVHRDYCTHRRDIYLHLLCALAGGTSRESFIRFSYINTGREGRVTLGILNAQAEAAELSPAKRADRALRVEHGDGRYQAHIVVLAEGASRRARLMPLRSDDNAVWEGLTRLASRIPAGTSVSDLRERFPEVCEGVDRLLKPYVQEIH